LKDFFIMANSLLTPAMITRESLRILHQKLNFVGSIVREYDDSFAKKGAKIGDTLKIRLPNQYTVRTGATLSAQDTTESSVSLQVGTQKGVDLNFTSVDLTLSLDDFSTRILDPALSVLAANIEADAMSMALDCHQSVWNGGSAATYNKFLDARVILQNALAPTNERTANLNSQDMADVVNDQGLMPGQAMVLAHEAAHQNLLGLDNYASSAGGNDNPEGALPIPPTPDNGNGIPPFPDEDPDNLQAPAPSTNIPNNASVVPQGNPSTPPATLPVQEIVVTGIRPHPTNPATPINRFTPRQQAFIGLVSRREGAGYNTAFGMNRHGQSRFITPEQMYGRHLSELSINELLRYQRALRDQTRRAGISLPYGTSAAGIGQFVGAGPRGGTVGNILRRLGIRENQWDRVGFTPDLQRRMLITDARMRGLDPDRVESWTQRDLGHLGNEWQSLDQRHIRRDQLNNELETIRTAGQRRR
jgi:hypothetical protein